MDQNVLIFKRKSAKCWPILLIGNCLLRILFYGLYNYMQFSLENIFQVSIRRYLIRIGFAFMFIDKVYNKLKRQFRAKKKLTRTIPNYQRYTYRCSWYDFQYTFAFFENVFYFIFEIPYFSKNTRFLSKKFDFEIWFPSMFFNIYPSMNLQKKCNFGNLNDHRNFHVPKLEFLKFNMS